MSTPMPELPPDVDAPDVELRCGMPNLLDFLKVRKLVGVMRRHPSTPAEPAPDPEPAPVQPFDVEPRDRAILPAETLGDLLYAAAVGRQALDELAQLLDSGAIALVDVERCSTALRAYACRLEHAIKSSHDYVTIEVGDDE